MEQAKKVGGMVAALRTKAIEARRRRVYKVETRIGGVEFYASISLARALAQHRRRYRDAADPFEVEPVRAEEVAALSNSKPPDEPATKKRAPYSRA